MNSRHTRQSGEAQCHGHRQYQGAIAFAFLCVSITSFRKLVSAESHAGHYPSARERSQEESGTECSVGQGNTSIKQVLVLLKDKKYPIRALVEYEHRGKGTPIEEAKQCTAYMQQALV
jgi:hypothetical protein